MDKQEEAKRFIESLATHNVTEMERKLVKQVFPGIDGKLCTSAKLIMCKEAENDIKTFANNNNLDFSVSKDNEYPIVTLCGNKKDVINAIKNEIINNTFDINSKEGNEEIWKGSHVKEIWEDGELTLTKGGDLFRQRNLHMTSMGGNILLWDTQGERHLSRVVPDNKEKYVEALQKLIRDIEE